MARFILINGTYDEVRHYVVTGVDIFDAIDNLKAFFNDMAEDDRPSVIDIIPIGKFDESAIVVDIG